MRENKENTILEAVNPRMPWTRKVAALATKLEKLPERTVVEASLLRRARAGDRAAFDRLMAVHERRVLSTALRLLGRMEDAQDAAQETFLRLYRGLDRVDAALPLEPWLYRVTVNVCRDLGRERGRRRAVPLDELAEPVAIGAGSNPATEFDRSEEARCLVADLARLAYKERAALVLRDVEGLSTEAVARALESSPTTVRSQICRARLKLQQYRAHRRAAARHGGVPS